MCGILGFVPATGKRETDLEGLCERMGMEMRHRGPDDSGVWIDRQIGLALGHRRLSIVDLSAAGRQPMMSANGRYVIVLNGEIYNFGELRKLLESSGYPFHGHSDTEVALATFERFGWEAALERFVGMFALALWDREERTLWLARDRVGEKPLYYATVNGTFLFASDLAALRRFPGWSPDIDRDSLGLMMRHFYVPAPRTIYQDVYKLSAGGWLRISLDGAGLALTPGRYWDASEVATDAAQNQRALEPALAVDQLDMLLRKTICDKMITDVPLGAFLSGGIDSSTIVALMQVESMKPVRTFSIGFEEAGYDEAVEAQRVAQHLGTSHTELYVSASEAQAVIPRLPDLYSEPFADSSQIPTYLVSALARQQVTVALSGDGGDELFGGYNRYHLGQRIWRRSARVPLSLRETVSSLARRLPEARIEQFFDQLRPMFPERWRHKQIGRKVQKLAALLSIPDEMEVYKSLISMWPEPSALVLGSSNVDLVDQLRGRTGGMPTFTERMMLLDFLTYLPDDILTKVDRASMGESLEVRVPFLDHRVAEHAWRMPLELKVRRGEGKWILKKVLERYVPRTLFERPKMGFGVPIGAWLRGPLRDWAETLLDSSRIAREGYFRATVVERHWRAHLEQRADNAHRLWPVLMFQAWLERYERPH